MSVYAGDLGDWVSIRVPVLDDFLFCSALACYVRSQRYKDSYIIQLNGRAAVAHRDGLFINSQFWQPCIDMYEALHVRLPSDWLGKRHNEDIISSCIKPFSPSIPFHVYC